MTEDYFGESLQEALDEGRFDPEHHFDWVVENSRFYAITLAPWIREENLEMLVRVLEEYEDVEGGVSNAVFELGSSGFVRRLLRATDRLNRSIYALIYDENLERLEMVLEEREFDEEEALEDIADVREDDVGLITEEVLEILRANGYEVE